VKAFFVFINKSTISLHRTGITLQTGALFKLSQHLHYRLLISQNIWNFFLYRVTLPLTRFMCIRIRTKQIASGFESWIRNPWLVMPYRYSFKKCELLLLLILLTGCCGLFGVAVIPIMQRYLSSSSKFTYLFFCFLKSGTVMIYTKFLFLGKYTSIVSSSS
jgi:hypothetical protein